MGNTLILKFLLANDIFQLIPSLSIYNNSLDTLRSAQLMQVPACFVHIITKLERFDKKYGKVHFSTQSGIFFIVTRTTQQKENI